MAEPTPLGARLLCEVCDCEAGGDHVIALEHQAFVSAFVLANVSSPAAGELERCRSVGDERSPGAKDGRGDGSPLASNRSGVGARL